MGFVPGVENNTKQQKKNKQNRTVSRVLLTYVSAREFDAQRSPNGENGSELHDAIVPISERRERPRSSFEAEISRSSSLASRRSPERVRPGEKEDPIPLERRTIAAIRNETIAARQRAQKIPRGRRAQIDRRRGWKSPRGSRGLVVVVVLPWWMLRRSYGR